MQMSYDFFEPAWPSFEGNGLVKCITSADYGLGNLDRLDREHTGPFDNKSTFREGNAQLVVEADINLELLAFVHRAWGAKLDVGMVDSKGLLFKEPLAALPDLSLTEHGNHRISSYLVQVVFAFKFHL